MSTTIVLVITLVAIFILYRYIERRLNNIEQHLIESRTISTPDDGESDSYLERISKKVDELKEISAPLTLLNIFDEDKSLTVGDDVYLEWLVSDFEKAEEIRASKIGVVNDTEREELEKYEKENPDEKKFTPSEYLQGDILAASAAIAVRQAIYNQLQEVKKIYFEVIGGKLSIEEARKKAKEVADRREYQKMEDVVHSPGLFNINQLEKEKEIDSRIREKFDDLYAMYAERWVNGKWKDRLKWYREMDEYEK